MPHTFHNVSALSSSSGAAGSEYGRRGFQATPVLSAEGSRGHELLEGVQRQAHCLQS